MKPFELALLGGPWTRRLAARHAGLDVDWGAIAREAEGAAAGTAREVWTRSAFSEYASAASFAQIASALLAAGAPVDLIAAAGEFVADEIFHTELSARVAMALGGAVPLEADLTKLARPPSGEQPLLRAAELVVRTCCVGEALTVPMLNTSRRAAGSAQVAAVIARILRDESQHAQLGWWFLDWAPLSDGDRERLARIAGETIESYSVIFAAECARESGLGRLDCATFDPVFLAAIDSEVTRPLAQRGIDISRHHVDSVRRAAFGDPARAG